MTDLVILNLFCETKDPKYLTQLTNRAFSLLIAEAEKHKGHPLSEIIISHKKKQATTAINDFWNEMIFIEDYNINGKDITMNWVNTPGEIKLKSLQIEALPKLYSKTKTGAVNWWQIYVFEDQYFRLGGQVGGKTRVYSPVTSTPKNIGKANETSGHEQAIFEAFSKWNKKKDQGYTQNEKGTDQEEEEEKDEDEEGQSMMVERPIILPMLANKYREVGLKHLKLPFAGSPKLDGIRCIVCLNKGEVRLTTRGRKELNWMNNIRKQVKAMLEGYETPSIILDGEIYSHSIPFNEISGAARKKGSPSTHDNALEFHIFDIVDESLTYAERVEIMKKLENIHNENTGENLKFVYYETLKSHDDVRALHDKYVSQGYEGLILRNFHGKYRIKHRSNDLLKFKDFTDLEVLVVGAQKAVGTEEGAIVFECKFPGREEIFTVRPRGSIAKRRWQYENKEHYVGKMLTIRYQTTGLEDGSLPRFPVGIKFRKAIEQAEPIDFRDYE